MGPVCFPENLENEYYILGLLNSCVGTMFLLILCPNLKFDQKPLESVPVVWKDKEAVKEKVVQCIEIARRDWDSSEISWEYRKHPFLEHYDGNKIEDAAKKWNEFLISQRKRIQTLEKEINEIFISAYGLSDVMDADIEEEDITLLGIDERRDVIDFISYAVGCMFGRYSLDEDGLIYAGGIWDATKYKRFIPDEDAIIPICDDEYFEDDIVGRFVDFVKSVFGEENLEDNLKYISDRIGGKGTSREVFFPEGGSGISTFKTSSTIG